MALRRLPIASCLGLAIVLHAGGRFELAIVACEQALRREPTHAAAYGALAWLLPAAGRGEELAGLHARWARHRPDDATAMHMHAAWSGRPLARASAGYVTELFDEFARSFDETLARLEYTGPASIGDAWSTWVGSGRVRCCLDAGCGTGLVGPVIRGAVDRLVGVDLSAAMLERAAARRVYDALVCAELEAHLHASAGVYDAIVAADVLVYFGELAEVASAIAGALAPGGVVIVTTEHGEIDDAFALQRSGRFVHRRDAAADALAGAGIVIDEVRELVLRREHGTAVMGTLTVGHAP